METTIEQRSWEELKVKLRTKFPQLIETDFLQNTGMENHKLRMVEYKLRKTSKEMQKIIAAL